MSVHENEQEPEMNPEPITPEDPKEQAADQAIMNHMMWSMGAGAIPIPVFDFVAVTAIHYDLLKKLFHIYGVSYNEDFGKKLVSAVMGTAAARSLSSAVKAIPGVGTLIGGVSSVVLSGATTYALGRLAVMYLRSGEVKRLSIDAEQLKSMADELVEEGKSMAESLRGRAATKESADPAAKLIQLKQLHDTGVISDEEYEQKRKKYVDLL